MSSNASRLQAAIRRLKPHDHLCLVYDSEKDWSRAVVAFLAAGLELREKCVYVADTGNADRVRAHLHAAGIDVAGSEAAGQLVIMDQAETYTQAGRFDPDRMIRLLVETARQALDEGYTALRGTGENTWLSRSYPGAEKFFEYEARINREVSPFYPSILLCQYNRSSMDPSTLTAATMSHPLVLRGHRLYRNSYYVPAEELLGKKASVYIIDRWLDNLEHEVQSEELAAFLAKAVTLSPHPFFVSESEGRITVCNQAFCALTGYRQEEVVGRDWIKDLSPPEWQAAVAKAQACLHATQRPVTFEQKLKRQDGTRVWVEQVLHLKGGENGQPQYYLCYTTDLSARRRLEDALRRLETLHRAVFENTGTALCLVEKNTLISRCNAQFAKLTGYARGEVEGRKSLTEFVIAEDLPQLYVHRQQCRVGPPNGSASFTCRLVDRDGNVTRVLVTEATVPGTTTKVVSLLETPGRDTDLPW